MRFLRLCALVAALIAATPIPGGAGWSSVVVANEVQPKPPEGFVPAEEVPPGEQIPAITLVATAYGFIWLAVLGYVWSLSRRLRQVESEISDLEARRR